LYLWFVLLYACEGIGQYFFYSQLKKLYLCIRETINDKEMLLPELKLRRDKIRSLMAQQEIDAALIACNVNLIYTYGRVVSGYLYLPLNAPARLFIKRPNNIEGEHIHPIRKPEQLPDLLKECGLPIPARLMLEGDELSFTEYNRLAACFPETEVLPCGTALIRKARSVKTEIEIEMFRRSGIAHAKAYEQIPSVYRPGMTDRQLSIEIERLMRLEGCLGIFRTFGQSMEIFMGSLLAGDNAGTAEHLNLYFSLDTSGLPDKCRTTRKHLRFRETRCQTVIFRKRQLIPLQHQPRRYGQTTFL
jgi:hypothetical protein